MYKSCMQDCGSRTPPLVESYHQPQETTYFCNSESESRNRNHLDHNKNCYYCNQAHNGKKTVKKSREQQYSRELDIFRTRSAPGSCPICPIRELCKTTLKCIEKFQKLKKSNSELIALCTKSTEHKKTDESNQTPKQLPETDAQSTAKLSKKSQSIENYNTNAQGDTKDNNKYKKRRHGGDSVSKKQKHKGKDKENNKIKEKAEKKEHDNGNKKRQRGGAAEPLKKKTVNAEPVKAKNDQTNGKRTSNLQSAGKSIAIKRQPVNPAIGEIKAQNMRARLEQLDIQRMERCPNGLECSCYPCGPSECAVQKCCNR